MASGGHIERILRNIEEVIISPKCGVLIETQTFFPGDIEAWEYANATLTNRICKLNNNYWLANENQFSIKEDELSAKYAGRIKLLLLIKPKTKLL